jgi:hypothetical protein
MRALDDDGVVTQHIVAGCHRVVSMKKGYYFGLYIRRVCMGWLMKWFSWYGQLDKSNAVDTFLEVVVCITKVLCSLLLRTCSKDTGAMQSGWTTFGGETGPTPVRQGRGDTIKQSFL